MPTIEEVTKFSKLIESFSLQNRIGIMDAIVTYCEKNNLEIEVASTLLNQNLKQKLYDEAQSLNLIPKEKKLPL